MPRLDPSFLIRVLGRYARWLHGRFPAGTVERLPVLREDGSTAVRGLYVTGDLTGIPLLKFAADSGARAVRAIVADPRFAAERRARADGVRELVIVGAGVSGVAAALEARRSGVDCAVLEARRPFHSIADFPRGKPIFAYPAEMVPAGGLHVEAEVKETLLARLEAQARPVEVLEGRAERVVRAGGVLEVRVAGRAPLRALRVIVAVGRSGNYRRLAVPGEGLDKVHNRLHDPADFRGRRVLVVGGGDAAVEAAVALDAAGAQVTLCHRGAELSRPRPRNLERLRAGSGVELRLATTVEEIVPDAALLRRADGTRERIDNDAAFVMIGREPPNDFLRRSGVRIAGDWNGRRTAALLAFVLACAALYDWKSGGLLDRVAAEAGAFPYGLAAAAERFERGSLARTVLVSAQFPAFHYTLAYSLVVVVFGVRRIRRRGTAYVRAQTLTLMAIQVLPLFLLPEVVLPWLDANGRLPQGIADALFPPADYGHGREFWRAYGFVLAWPLNVYNVFTGDPLGAWLAISFVQTFVAIPALVYFWGKGAYCGWICPCGALAETLGDTERHKMPHGRGWNRLNLAGQGILALACALLALRVASWVFPELPALRAASDLALSGSLLSYKWVVDVFLAGVLGYGLYFWFSGRVWCRFFCPLAALMHVYARFSRFRIFADKPKCISCNACTATCHQGIDVMGFANRGLPMDDPQCVRCAACIDACPTDVLSFGRVGRVGHSFSEPLVKTGGEGRSGES